MSEALAEYFRGQAAWRHLKAEEYREDDRNRQSAEALESLAEYVIHEDAEHLVRPLEPFLDEHFTLAGEQAAREVSRYGFGYRVGDGQHEAFLEELWTVCMADAYDYATEHGEDTYGVLIPAEVEAARNDVFIPDRHWERRRNWSESEIEEAIAEYSEADDA